MQKSARNQTFSAKPPGDERRQLPPQGQPAGRHCIVCTGAGWRVALTWPSAHGARSHANAKIRVVSHYLGGTLFLRPVVCFAAALDT